MAEKRSHVEIIDQWFKKHFSADPGAWGNAYTHVREKLDDLKNEFAKDLSVGDGKRSVPMEPNNQ